MVPHYKCDSIPLDYAKTKLHVALLYITIPGFSRIRNAFPSILPNARPASRVTVDSLAISILDEVKFLYRSKNLCYTQFVLHRLLFKPFCSKSSLPHLLPVLVENYRVPSLCCSQVTSTSRCWDIPSSFQKTFSTQNFHTGIKRVPIGVIIVSTHQIFCLCWMSTDSVILSALTFLLWWWVRYFILFLFQWKIVNFWLNILVLPWYSSLFVGR